MSKAKHLGKKQIELIDDLFENKKDQSDVLKTHNISWTTYSKWLMNEHFGLEIDNRIAAAKKKAAAHLAASASKAIENLVNLSGGNGETARKACLDLIALQNQPVSEPQAKPKDSEQPKSPAQELSPETASRILAALAEENEN